MTPYEISIMLHYATRHGDWNDGDFSAPICVPTLEGFVKAGLLIKFTGTNPMYAITKRGAAFYKALQLVPLPEPAFVIKWPTKSTIEDGI